MLKSNGLRHSKNLPVKFVFSLKTVPANIAKKLPSQRCFKPLLIPIFNFSYKRPTFAFTGESGYTLGPAQRIAHNGTHGETGAVSDGGAITTLGAFHTFRKPCVARCQNGKLCRFWVLAGCAPEERRKPSEQRCAHARRCSEGVAAPLGCVIFFAFVEIGICTSGAHGFPRVRGMGGITTLGALCVLLKYRTAACQSGSFAVFLRPLFTFAKDPAG